MNPQVSATCSVIGADAQGNRQTWAAAQNLTLANGATAADLSEELFRQTGLKADYNPNGSWGWALNTIASPFDKGLTLGWDSKTGKYWQLFINGKASSVGAGGYVLEEGDSIQWAYSAYGESAPTDALRCRAKSSAKTLTETSRFGRSRPPSICLRGPLRPI